MYVLNIEASILQAPNIPVMTYIRHRRSGYMFCKISKVSLTSIKLKCFQVIPLVSSMMMTRPSLTLSESEQSFSIAYIVAFIIELTLSSVGTIMQGLNTTTGRSSTKSSAYGEPEKKQP